MGILIKETTREDMNPVLKGRRKDPVSTKDEKFNRFSVPLGLLDYINPICNCITNVVCQGLVAVATLVLMR